MKTFCAVGRAAVTTGVSSCAPLSPAASPTTTASPGMTASFQPTANHRPLCRSAPRWDVDVAPCAGSSSTRGGRPPAVSIACASDPASAAGGS